MNFCAVSYYVVQTPNNENRAEKDSVEVGENKISDQNFFIIFRFLFLACCGIQFGLIIRK